MDFTHKAIRLLLFAYDSGDAVVIPCDSREQADHYRRKFYSVRTDLRHGEIPPDALDQRPELRTIPWDAFTFSIREEQGSTQQHPFALTISYDPSPVDRTLTQLGGAANAK